MSDTGSRGAVPDATRAYNMAAQVNIKLPEVEAAAAAVASLSNALKGLETALSSFSTKSSTLAQSINANLKTIGTTATTVSGQMAGLTSAVGSVGGTGGRGTVTSAAAAAASSTGSGGGTAAAGGSGWVSSAITSATASVDRVVNKNLGAGVSLGSFVGTGGGDGASGLLKDLALSPLRWLRDRVNTNRDTAMMSSGIMNMAAMQQGVGTGSVMTSLSKFPGSIYGTPQDLLSLFSAAPALGASYGFGGGGSPGVRGQGATAPPGQGVRAAGFLGGIREMQMMNPLASVSDMTTQLGEYSGSTGSQQRAQMLTGGAMGMIAAGGRQKSLSEWAESILRWFEGLRPGSKRGKGFDYGELMAQYFPGSNIDAWFQTTGVPQNMRDYWWTYALAKANKVGGTGADKKFEIGTDENNVASQRLRSSSELTRTEFSVAGQMSGQYAQRESSNRWFNELTGQIQSTIIPAISKSIFRWIQYLPDSLEDLMMTGAERGASALFGKGDVDSGIGDIGDAYGETGGTGLSGLHPDMKSKVGAMMRANPKIKVNSGLRDVGLQRKLREKGNTNVSGKSSAHTRGMAADLGPSSQYKWIAKNASKFGLASGKGHGEPWHVGMKGDIPGVGDAGVGDMFDDFIGAFSDFTSSPEGMAGMIAKLLNTMTGGLGKLLGAGEDPTGSFADSPDDLYARLARASKDTKIGLNPKSTSIWDNMLGPGASGSSLPEWLGGPEQHPGTSSGWGSNSKQWVGTNSSGRGDRYSMVASADILQGIRSNDISERGQAVAKALHNAGFSGETLRKFLMISFRESHWTANAWNSGPKDESGGILQANQLPWTKNHQAAPFTVADAMDPQAAAYIAWDQYNNVAPLNGPGGKPTMSPWNINGNPLAGIPAEAAGYTDDVLKKTGLGDIDAMKASLALVGAKSGGGGISFHNEFNLSVPSYGGGSSSGIDLRRTVTLIADHLEDEMNRRLKRSA